MVRFSAPAWGVALFVFTLSITLVQGQGCGTDGQGCTINQWKECSSNVLHTAFLLDRSGSMEFGINCKVPASLATASPRRRARYCDARDGRDPFKQGRPISCPETILPATLSGQNRNDGCYRADIMRIVLRLVLKKMFNTYARGCYEYLQSNSYRATGLDCVKVGFTTTIFHIIWWSDELQNQLTFEQFTKGNDSKWSKELDAYLFKSNGDRRDERWVRVNGEFKIRDAAVNEFFDKIFLKQRGDFDRSVIARYPYGAGGTKPTNGINRYTTLLDQTILPGLEGNQVDGQFPVFLMTDGELTDKEEEKEEMATATANLRALRQGSLNIKTYGLGLSGDPGLTTIQTQLYNDPELEYISSTTLANGETVPHFFSDQESANKIVDAIISRIDTCDTVCYQPQGREKKCIKEGEPVPTWEGINDGQTEAPEVTDDVHTGDDDETGEPVQRKPKEDLFVKFSGSSKVYKIEASTVLCKSKTKNGYEFVEYEDDGTCKCCAKLGYQKGDGKCLCDFRADDGLGESIEPVGASQVDRKVTTYNSGSALSKEVAQNPRMFSSDDTANTDDGDDSTETSTGKPPAGADGDGVVPNPNDAAVEPTPPTKAVPASGSIPALSSLALLPALLSCALQAFD